ncbi:AMP-binding protein [bacterium]|nr:AMP-binding protein [bacterium]
MLILLSPKVHTSQRIHARTLPELIARTSEFESRVWCKGRDGERIWTISYGEFLKRVKEIAGAMRVMGIGVGDRVAIMGENSAEWMLHYFAVVWNGSVVVPIDTLMAQAEVEEVLRRAAPKLLLATPGMVKLVELIDCEQIPVRSISSEFANAPALAPALAMDAHPAKPEDIAALIFTSGTTGHSKAVMLSHGNLASNAISSWSRIPVRQEDVFYLLLPLHHAFSATVNMLLPITAGSSIATATSYKSRDILDDVRLCGVTFLVAVPQVYENLRSGIVRKVEQAPFAKRLLFKLLLHLCKLGLTKGASAFRSLREKGGLSSLRLMASGGAALPSEENRFFNALGIPLIQGYGLTETSPVLSVNPPEKNRVGSVGPAIQGVELRIDDPDQEGTGEICARGEGIMLGYFEDEAATARVLRDGWFHTGDAGHLDRDGYLHITGRIKNIIVTHAGKNVYPEEIEAKLNQSEWILESLVYGVKSEQGGEEICARIVPDQEYAESRGSAGDAESADEEIGKIVAHYNSSVAAYRRIRSYELRREPFEKSSTRKIRRFLYKK